MCDLIATRSIQLNSRDVLSVLMHKQLNHICKCSTSIQCTVAYSNACADG